jgi:hypothetical protein
MLFIKLIDAELSNHSSTLLIPLIFIYTKSEYYYRKMTFKSAMLCKNFFFFFSDPDLIRMDREFLGAKVSDTDPDLNKNGSGSGFE